MSRGFCFLQFLNPFVFIVRREGVSWSEMKMSLTRLPLVFQDAVIRLL